MKSRAYVVLHERQPTQVIVKARRPYVARVSPAEVTLNDEAQEYRWVSAAEALTIDLNRPTRILLDEAMIQGLVGDLA